jgi:hypothetical protein
MQMTLCRLHRRLLFAAIAMGTVVAGCDSDQRAVEISRESLNRQAEQNHEMARQNQSVTATTQQLIQSETDVQHDGSQLHEQLHTERSALDQQRQDLEGERRSLADERQRDSILGQAIPGVVAMIVAALPLVVCWYLARSMFVSVSDDSTAAEILIEQLATQGPLLTACSTRGLPDDERSPNLLPSGARRLLEHAKLDISAEQGSALRVVVVVEGAHDVEFLKRISRILAETDTHLPDLGQLEAAGVVAFVVNNGASIAFPAGLAANGPVEFHLLDREAGPTAVQRQAALLAINARPHCRATLTSKRAIENYLHPDAVGESAGIKITFGDFDDVADVAAQVTFDQSKGGSWGALSRRARRRLRDKAKKWLNQDAVDRMTPRRLAERDPNGEVIGWLRTIAELAAVPVDTSI